LINLEDYGFDPFFKKDFEKYQVSGFEPGRISAEDKLRYRVITRYGEIPGEVTGRFLYDTEDTSTFPKTGDWVVIMYFQDEHKCIIHNLLSRRSRFSRGKPGSERGSQIIAANIDYVFVVQSFNADLSINRLERYIVMSEEGNCTPVLLLNKNDLVENPEDLLYKIKSRIRDLAVFSISCETGSGFDELRSFISPAKTYALTGSSGVGKSSIINFLMNRDLQRVSDIRLSDDRGKHTTTRRELFLLPEGGIIIDTPGMREFSMRDNQINSTDVFADISDLSAECRYKDCTHIHEEGCAVKSALQQGSIKGEHYANYLKLRKESEYYD
jgi:ribosome biogenesis GTPase